MLWTTLVSSHEDKHSLKAVASADTGRGQLYKTACRVIDAQGKRAFIVSALMSCQEL